MRRWHALTLVRRAPQMSAADLLDPLPEVASQRSKMARKIHIWHTLGTELGRWLPHLRPGSFRASLAMLAPVCAPHAHRARAAQLHDLLLPYADRHILTANRHSWGSVAPYLAMLETVLGQRPRRD
jgi:hypothetical protein